MESSVTAAELKPKQSKGELSAKPGPATSSPTDAEPTHGALAGMPLFLGSNLQRRLEVGPVDDPLEREADRVAGQVMSAGNVASESISVSPKVANDASQRTGLTGIDIQRRGDGSGGVAPAVPPIVHDALHSPGQPMDASVRPQMESRFGRDFGDVRLHTDAGAAESAQSINAVAYTAGNHVVFDSGQYSPNTRDGQRLLAHELTHTIQQGGTRSSIQRQPQDQSQQAANSAQPTAAPAGASFANAPQLPGQDLDAVVWPYPAIAAALPKEVVELRASASLELPLTLLLRPDMAFVDQDIWENYFEFVQLFGGDAMAAEMLRNEMMRQYLSDKLNDPVQIVVDPPLAPGAPVSVSFQFHGQEVYTPDGMLGGPELAPFGSIDAVAQRVQEQAASVELAAQLLNGLDDLEPALAELKRVSTEPEDFAVNDVASIRWQIQSVKEIADDWGCRTGPVPAKASSLIARYNEAYSEAMDAARFINQWHTDNPMESAGQANVRRGRPTGDWYDWPVRIFWGTVDTGEEVLSAGHHSTRTAISEAYANGDISWEEAKRLVNKSARRAILTAAVARAMGPLAGRFGVGFAGKLGLSRAATVIFGQAVGGVITSSSALATQAFLTHFGGGGLSTRGGQIWNAGMPGAGAWGFGVVSGGILGGLVGGRSLAPPSETPPVGTAPGGAPASGAAAAPESIPGVAGSTAATAAEDFPFANGRTPPWKPESPNKVYRIMSMDEAAQAMKSGQLPGGAQGTMGSKFVTLDSKYAALFREKALATMAAMGEGITKAESSLRQVEARIAQLEASGDQLGAAKLRTNAAKLQADIEQQGLANKAAADPMMQDWFAAPGQKVVVEIEVEDGTIDYMLERAVEEKLIGKYAGQDIFIWKLERGYGRNLAIPSWQLGRFNGMIKSIRLYAYRGVEVVGRNKISKTSN